MTENSRVQNAFGYNACHCPLQMKRSTVFSDGSKEFEIVSRDIWAEQCMVIFRFVESLEADAKQ